MIEDQCVETQVKREDTALDAVHDLTRGVESIDKALAAIALRLGPILGPDSPMIADENRDEDSMRPVSDLQLQARSIGVRLQDLADRVYRLHHRIDLPETF
jgi:hypothetical protein